MRVLLRLLHQSNIPGRNRVILVTILFQFYLQNHLQTTSDGSIIEIEKKENTMDNTTKQRIREMLTPSDASALIAELEAQEDESISTSIRDSILMDDPEDIKSN